MMRKMDLKRFTAPALALIMVLALSGCGSSASSSDESSADTSADADAADDDSTEVRTIVIATGGTGPEPYVYVDENDNLTGYDIELLRLVFEQLPQYEIEFEITEFASIFTGMDSDLYQMGVNHLGYTAERASKYLISDCYDVSIHAIAVRTDYDEIETVYDFAGHSTEITSGSYNETAFLNYNEENPDSQIILTYVDDANNMPLDVANGVIDFEYFTKTTLVAQIEEYGLTEDLKLIDVPLEDSSSISTTLDGIFYYAAQSETQLLADFNEAFEALLADGSVQALREEWGLTDDETDGEALLTQDYVDYAAEWIESDLAAQE